MINSVTTPEKKKIRSLLQTSNRKTNYMHEIQHNERKQITRPNIPFRMKSSPNVLVMA